MADMRLAAVEIELGLRDRADPDDPYAGMPEADRPDGDLRAHRSPDALEEATGTPVGEDHLDRDANIDGSER